MALAVLEFFFIKRRACTANLDSGEHSTPRGRVVTCIFDDRMLERIDLYPEAAFHQIMWFLGGISMSEVSLSLSSIRGRVIGSSIFSGPGFLAWSVPEPGASTAPNSLFSGEDIKIQSNLEECFGPWPKA
jgi:hypothetical protein